MHVAGELFVEAFEAQVEGERVSPDTVFPDWSPLDRFGIVVTEPLGGLGASLLIQLAIAMFYSVRPDRRAGAPVYPEIYLLHVGGPHGDFSYFDFWPPRKEVRVAAAQPVSLLEAINAHGITRLAMPLGADVVERRVDEVAQSVRDRVAAALAARGSSGELVEVYQRVTTAESLAYIAGRF